MSSNATTRFESNASAEQTTLSQFQSETGETLLPLPDRVESPSKRQRAAIECTAEEEW